MKSKLLVNILAIVGIISLTIGVSIAFFNYTRTGNGNTIAVGRIYFNTLQTNAISLTNVFPIDSDNVDTDTDNVGTVSITVTGDTTYDNGVEYLISAVNVNNRVNNKSIPISVNVSTSGTLGTLNRNYFEDRDSASNHIYKVVAREILEEDEQLMVGYIARNATGINGTINIKAYLDKDKIAVSDTYDGTESNNMGTTSNWVNNRTVLTTTEWNSLAANGLSFQIKVEANEGTWVEEQLSTNVMNTLPDVITDEKLSIKEIYFNKMDRDVMESRYNTATIKADVTYNNEGKVLAWLEPDTVDNTKHIMYVASDGDTYFTTGENLFSGYTSVEKIQFNNVDTNRVTTMSQMFSGCTSLEELDVSMFETYNVTSMFGMFAGCSSLVSIGFAATGGSGTSYGIISSFNTSNVTDMSSMFASCRSLTNLDLHRIFNTSSVTNMSGFLSGCTNLISVNLSGLGSSQLSNINGLLSSCPNLTTVNMNNFNFGTSSMSGLFRGTSLQNITFTGANMRNVTNMSGMFYGCSGLTSIDLSGLITNSVTDMSGMFNGCTNLANVDLSGLGSAVLSSLGGIFSNCTNLKTINMSNFNFGTASNIYGLFPNSIQTIILSNATMSNINSLGGFFYNLGSLQSVDLSGVNTSNITNMTSMFAGCTNLTTIYVSSSWNVSNVTSSDAMFQGCTSLVGGNGTTYNSSIIDKTRAIIDGGTSNPGYLTLKTS